MSATASDEGDVEETERDTPKVVAYQRHGRVVLREETGGVGAWIEGVAVEAPE